MTTAKDLFREVFALYKRIRTSKTDERFSDEEDEEMSQEFSDGGTFKFIFIYFYLFLFIYLFIFIYLFLFIYFLFIYLFIFIYLFLFI